jgi:hypothetical protein
VSHDKHLADALLKHVHVSAFCALFYNVLLWHKLHWLNTIKHKLEYVSQAFENNMLLDQIKEEMLCHLILNARWQLRHQDIQILPDVNLIVNLAQVSEYHLLNTGLKLQVLHGGGSKFNLFIKASGA